MRITPSSTRSPVGRLCSPPLEVLVSFTDPDYIARTNMRIFYVNK